MSSTTSKRLTLAEFRRLVWRYYKEHGRHTLPWRQTHDPYHILVSELMLQQTQVDRVIPKYEAFMNTFPTVSVLAEASLRDVLRLWQGLGYNRRAKYLHEAAKAIVAAGGVWPETEAGLRTLPGIGPYTAGAVLAFSFARAIPIIETNIRAVILHHYFSDETAVSDAEVKAVVAETLPRARVREWYYALMDYGVFLKKTHSNPNRRSKHHVVQSKFVGSNRQLRGAILRLLGQKNMTQKVLVHELREFDSSRVVEQLKALMNEGLITKSRTSYRLPI